MTKSRSLGILLVTLVVGAGLTVWALRDSFVAATPAGFASYGDWFGFRAASPDGVVFQVRDVDNEPAADLPFWKEALKKRMLDAGYVLLRDGDIQASGAPGYLLELTAPQGTDDYSYLIALFENGSDLVLAESAGEVTRHEKRRDAVLAAIGTLKLR